MLGAADLVLCSGTMLKASIPEMIEAAVAGGFSGITLWPQDYQRARDEGLSDADLRHMLADSGIEIADLDPLLTWVPGESESEGPDGLKFAREEEFYAIADAVGGRSINLAQPFSDSIDIDAAAEAIAGVCDRAADHGLLITLEFLPWTGVSDAAIAWEIVRLADRPNATVMVDSWHHFRGPCDHSQLRAIPGDKIGGVQLNDAPRLLPTDRTIIEESMDGRCLPGEGDIPLVEIVQALDASGTQAPFGLEVFSAELDKLPPIEVGRRGGEAMRRLLAKARA